MPKDASIGSVLIIGSGPIIIGQACEFDYSGSQAARSLREEGVKVILINSNPATIMTDPMMADRVYLLPLNVESIETILKENQIDAVLPTMGGQTALNLAKEAEELGIWEKYNVRLIGVDIKAIDKAEDKYNNVEVKIITTPDSQMSGTNARKALLANDKEAFFKFLPARVKEKEEIFTILRPAALNEDLTFEKKRALIKKIIQGRFQKYFGF